MLAIAVPAGLLIGLSLGVLGGGGSILTVPVLVYLLHQAPHAATTGSLLIVGIAATGGMIAHWRDGRVRLWPGVTFGVLGVAGSYAGARLSASVPPGLLISSFAVLMLVAAAAMLRRRRGTGDPGDRAAENQRGAGRAPGARIAWLRRDTTGAARQGLKIIIAATGVGLLTGFFGVGGGFVIVPMLVLALGFDMSAAVGTSLLVIAINSATALAIRLGSHARLDWPLLGVFTVAALAGALAGNRVASRADASRLTTAFAVLLIAVAAYSLGRSLPQLA